MHQPAVREHTGDQRSRRGDPRQFAGQLDLSEKHSWNEAETQRIGLDFMRSQRELQQQINRRAQADDGERCQRPSLPQLYSSMLLAASSVLLAVVAVTPSDRGLF